MRISTSTVTKLTITGVEHLDPVSVFVEDFGPGKGKLTVECFGDAWSHYWCATGEDSLVAFLSDASVDYIANKLWPCDQQQRVVDYDKIAADTGEENICQASLLLLEDKVAAAYGEDWHHHLPTKPSHQWEYLCRIVAVVKEAACSLLEVPA